MVFVTKHSLSVSSQGTTFAELQSVEMRGWEGPGISRLYMALSPFSWRSMYVYKFSLLGRLYPLLTLITTTPFTRPRPLFFRAQLKHSLGTPPFPFGALITLAINYLCH